VFSQLAQPVHQVDGMSNDEFAESEAAQVTIDQTTVGYQSLTALVEGAMK
jgi:hypothetical protein